MGESPGLSRARDLLLLASIPGFAISSTALLLATPWLLLRFAYAASAVAVHFAMGLAFLLGNVYALRPMERWRGACVVVGAYAYAIGLAALAVHGDLQVPFYSGSLVLAFAFPVLVMRVDWSRVSRVLGPGGERYVPWLLVLAAALIRVPFYLAPVRLSTDVNAYSYFARSMEAGAVPYRDVFIPYTPGITLFLQIIASIHVVPGLRAILAVPDLLLVRLLAFGSEAPAVRYRRAVAWALLPLAIVDIAWSGHVDGMVALLIVATAVGVSRRESIVGAVLGLASAMRPIALAVVPTTLEALPSRKRILVFSTCLLVVGGAITLVYAGFLQPVLSNSVVYQFSRPSVNSLSFYTVWFWTRGEAGPAGVDLSVGASLAAVGLLVAINTTLLLHKARDGKLFRWYGNATLLAIVLWGVLILTFPLTFLGFFSVSPAWPFYSPVAYTAAFGALIVLMALLAWREWRGMGWGAEERRRWLLALNLMVPLFFLQVFYSWYLLWAAPILVLLLPRRAAVFGLVAFLALAPSSYHSPDFNGLGSARDAVEIQVSTFSIANVTAPPNGTTPSASYQVEGERGRITLSDRGNVTVVSTLDRLDPAAWPILTITTWSDVDSIGWNRESITIWIRGWDGLHPIDAYRLAVENDTGLVPSGRSFFVNLFDVGLFNISGIVIQFRSSDPAPHSIWIGNVEAFHEYR